MKGNAYLKNISAMTIFGTIGLFVRAIDLPSSELALLRTLLGSGFLIAVLLIGRKKLNWKGLKRNLPILLFSGLLMGFNWVTLFEAYRCTTVSISTLLYYCAPVIVLLLSPLVLREKLRWPKLVGIGCAMLGLGLVNGGPVTGTEPIKGVLCAAAAAALYAGVILLNKFVRELSGLETTLVQLLAAAAVLLVYDLITLRGEWVLPVGESLIYTLIVGLFHTGFAYLLYFSSVQYLAGQSLALISYIDPFLALLLSALLLGERMTAIQILGTVLILGGAAFGELYNADSRPAAGTAQTHEKGVTS